MKNTVVPKAFKASVWMFIGSSASDYGSSLLQLNLVFGAQFINIPSTFS